MVGRGLKGKEQTEPKRKVTKEPKGNETKEPKKNTNNFIETIEIPRALDRTVSDVTICCPECKYKCHSYDVMLHHIRKIHRGQKPYQCPKCPYSSKICAVLKEHINIHMGIKPYKCSMCPYTCANKSNVKKHERRHKPEATLQCPECNYKGLTNKGILSHIKQAHNRSKHACYNCKKEFESKCNLLVHVRAMSHCKTCRFACCTETDLRKHVEKCSVAYTEANIDAELIGDIIDITDDQDEDMDEDNKGENQTSLYENMSEDIQIGKAKNDDSANMSEVTIKVHEQYSRKNVPGNIIQGSLDAVEVLIKIEEEKSDETLPRRERNKFSKLFACQLCNFHSRVKTKVLLHLIHHPNQSVNENFFDVSVLKKFKIIE